MLKAQSPWSKGDGATPHSANPEDRPMSLDPPRDSPPRIPHLGPMCRGGSRELFSPLPTSTSGASSLLIHQCFSEPQKVSKDNPLVLSYSSATSKREEPLPGPLSLVLISPHSSESRSSRRATAASPPLPSQSPL